MSKSHRTNEEDIMQKMVARSFSHYKYSQLTLAADETLKALLVEEIDHEIALRTRLQETVQSRLTWALILQETLQKHFSAPQNEGPCVLPYVYCYVLIHALHQM